MKEIPILFSTPMVQAILDGRKTQTRRLIKPQPIDNRFGDGNFYEGRHKGYVKVDGHPNWRNQFAYEFSKWKLGDILWVRESFKIVPPNLIFYKADQQNTAERGWKPSIHMPKEAARIWLQVEEIRVECLQDISDDDARSEGILMYRSEIDNRIRYKDYLADSKGYGHPDHDYPTVGLPVASFCTLWEAINGPDSWYNNPWVWVVKFKVLSTTGKPAL